MKDTIIEKISSIIDLVDPSSVNWSDAGNILNYIFNTFIVFGSIITIIAIAYFYKSILKFFRAVVIELKITDWIKRNELIKLSSISILIVIFITLFLLLTDQLFLLARNFVIFNN